MNRRTKIVCTLGPATRSADAIRALVEAGMDVARLNFSHGTHDDHAALCAAVRDASDSVGRAVGVLADLQGPKIRLGSFSGGAAILEPGSLFTISTEPGEGSSEGASVTYEALARDMIPGDMILVDDGLIRLEAIATDQLRGNVTCRVLEGGPLSDHKGVNLPGTRLGTPAMTGKDVDDLAFALRLGVDMVALSFVREAADVAGVRLVMQTVGRHVPVIAKIEKPEAVADLDAIVDAFDGVMVARGDLGIELSPEQVPMVQKRVVQLGRERAKPVIVATQLLDSMTHRLRPTRAEASDVANAVLDGADALMLAGETAVGVHPSEAVATMGRIAATIEQDAMTRYPSLSRSPSNAEEAVAAAATGMGAQIGACAVAVFTDNGSTAQHLAGRRSSIPVLAITSDPAVRSRLTVTWGVETFVMPWTDDPAQAAAQVDMIVLGLGRGRRGDQVVIVDRARTVRVHELAVAETRSGIPA
ncbi:MAG: pyruvate kinase [Actinomycetota bacterium]|nr:pyruvate kinase [Actinomycetota bacterium]